MMDGRIVTKNVTDCVTDQLQIPCNWAQPTMGLAENFIVLTTQFGYYLLLKYILYTN